MSVSSTSSRQTGTSATVEPAPFIARKRSNSSKVLPVRRALAFLNEPRVRRASCSAACGYMRSLQRRVRSGAQTWNDARSRALVEQATARRAAQIADTALVDYKAAAHGYLTFLAQVGEGFTEPPKIVKADELALEVYWRAPDLSKQLIAGRRDTLLLPTDINYHRDHLGIVQNNFPNIMRLGDGDEVRDVPHPLSAQGLAMYDYAISDSLQHPAPDRAIDVYEVRVRPKDDRQPRPSGPSTSTGKAAKSCAWRSASRAPRSSTSSSRTSVVVLENALIERRFWLPRRQEIEIRRTGSWLDYPARGIIRGRWEICCYQVNKGFRPGSSRGPEIVHAPPRSSAPYRGRAAFSIRCPPTCARSRTRTSPGAGGSAGARARQALARTRRRRSAARSVSDFVRVNRVEGLALGAGSPGGSATGFSSR